MKFREATISDIPGIQVVRHLVKENILSDPSLVTDKHCEEFLTERGKGWVCEVDDKIVGFSIVDLKENNVWALFVDPAYEGQGIGKKLHDLMLDWYFSITPEKLWLGTGKSTRAETFYKLQGWEAVGMHSAVEVKFEITAKQWEQKNNQQTAQDNYLV